MNPITQNLMPMGKSAEAMSPVAASILPPMPPGYQPEPSAPSPSLGGVPAQAPAGIQSLPPPGAPQNPPFTWRQQADGSAVAVMTGPDGTEIVLPGYAKPPAIPKALQPQPQGVPHALQ